MSPPSSCLCQTFIWTQEKQLRCILCLSKGKKKYCGGCNLNPKSSEGIIPCEHNAVFIQIESRARTHLNPDPKPVIKNFFDSTVTPPQSQHSRRVWRNMKRWEGPLIFILKNITLYENTFPICFFPLANRVELSSTGPSTKKNPSS